MTGRYPQRFGHEFNIGPTEEHEDYGLPLTETTMAARLKSAGYRTAVFGKWHLGSADKFHPMDRGFDEFFGFLHGGHSYLDPGPAGNPLLDGRKPADKTPYLTDALADRAVDFIERHQTQPFFLYLAFNAVHVPMHATDRYLAAVRPHSGRQSSNIRRHVGGHGRRHRPHPVCLARGKARREHARRLLQRQRRADDRRRPERIDEHATARLQAADLRRRHPRAVHDAVARAPSARPRSIPGRSFSWMCFRPRSPRRPSRSKPKWPLDGINLLPLRDRAVDRGRRTTRSTGAWAA